MHGDRLVADAEGHGRVRARRVPHHVRERLLGDAVEPETRRCGKRSGVAGQLEIDVEAGGLELAHQLGDVRGRGHRRRGTRPLGREQPDGATDLGQALATETLRLQ